MESPVATMIEYYNEKILSDELLKFFLKNKISNGYDNTVKRLKDSGKNFYLWTESLKDTVDQISSVDSLLGTYYKKKFDKISTNFQCFHPKNMEAKLFELMTQLEGLTKEVKNDGIKLEKIKNVDTSHFTAERIQTLTDKLNKLDSNSMKKVQKICQNSSCVVDKQYDLSYAERSVLLQLEELVKDKKL